MKFDEDHPPKGTIRDWIDHRAETSPDAFSHLFPSGETPLTWAELRSSAQDIAHRIMGAGVSKGESIALCQPNSCNAMLTLFGTLYGGFRATALNLAAGPAALGYALGHSGARLAFVDERQSGLFSDALKESGANPLVVSVSRTIDWPDDHVSSGLPLLNASDHALLMYTSGTTGRPKGVVHTHSSLLAGGWTPTIAHNLTDADRAMCVLPFFHINGLCVTLIGPLVSGGTAIVAEKFSNSRFWEDCDTYKATWFSVVPTIISHLLHSDRDPSSDTKSRLRFGRSASAPLSPEVQSAFESRFDVPIIETMGLTETAAQILSNPLPPGLRKIGSPGFGYGNEVAILDKEDRPVEAETVGEIAVRGPNVMLEYLNNPEATSASFNVDKWLCTGDLGYMDKDGYVFVTGRLKELIIKGGENIAPREIDEALYCHSDVVEAGAFALPCETYGQRVEAAVTLSSGSKATAGELLDLCQQKLGAFKCPDKVHFLDELPKGPSGKIQRLKLSELFAS